MKTPKTPSTFQLEEPAVGSYFVSTYPPFSCWDSTGAERFRQLLESPPQRSDDGNLGLYVHIPFCTERCHYCYYLSYADQLRQTDRYVDALIDELRVFERSPWCADRRISFVYFGGGTPSAMSALQIRKLMGGLQSVLPWTGAQEVTFECAPKTVTVEKLETLREFGVTRISLGVQQLDDQVLRASGRVHCVRDVETAYEKIRQVGFAVTNLDLMIGLMEETDETFQNSLTRVLDWKPESVTFYQLEIPLNTPLYRLLADGTAAQEPASWEVKRRRLRQGFARLEDSGYHIRSAYAAVRDPERHRFVYQEDQYHGANMLGIGASSFSHLDNVQHQNIARLDKYLEARSDGKLPLWRGYALNHEERVIREFVLQLKLGSVETKYFRDKFHVEIRDVFAQQLAPLQKQGWLEVGDNAVTLTRDGLVCADRLLPAFYHPAHQGLRYS